MPSDILDKALSSLLRNSLVEFSFVVVAVEKITNSSRRRKIKCISSGNVAFDAY